MATKKTDNKANKKQDVKKNFTRIICLVLAGLMVLSAVVSAVLSQVW